MDVLMPQLGETVAEGKITKWFKSAGDAVKPGDNLFEIETDKVSMEVPSIAAGTLSEIRVQAGDVAPVGAVVAIIAGEGGAAASAPAAKAASAPPPPAASKPAPQPFVPAKAGTQGQGLGPRFRGDERRKVSRIQTSIRFLKFARRRGISGLRMSAARPSRRWRAGSRAKTASICRGSPAPARADASSRPTSRRRSAAARGAPRRRWWRVRRPGRSRRSTTTSSSRNCRSTACATPSRRRLVEAKQTIPHFYLTADVTMDALLRLREDANAGAPKAGETAAYRLSVNDFVIKALALALQRIPAANAVWAGDRILRFKHSDVGVAVAIDGGLLTPVIRNAEAKSLSAISNEMRELAGRAKRRSSSPRNTRAAPRRSPISACTGSASSRRSSTRRSRPSLRSAPRSAVPVEAEDGSVKFVSQMTVTLSCDHRVVDGALGAELLAAFRALIENPVLMLV